MHSLTPQQVIDCARGWIGTRYHHQGRVKRNESHKGGVDCLGLLVGVAKELELTGKNGEHLFNLDRTDYGLFPNGEAMREKFAFHLHEIKENSRIGDIILFELDGSPRHLALMSEIKDEKPSILHAYAQARQVVEHPLDIAWKSRIKAIFRLPQLVSD